MAQVQDIVQAIEKIAPRAWALPWDNVGLQVGDPAGEVRRAVVSLDRSLAAIEFCRQDDAQLLISHHPLLFEPIKSVTTGSYEGRSILQLASAGIAFVAAHTNWDAAPGGINDTLAQCLELKNITSFGTGAEVSKLRLVVSSPAPDVQNIIHAATEAGAGEIGFYQGCAFFNLGTGQFVPRVGANPTVGSVNQSTSVEEWRIEMILPVRYREQVKSAVRFAHSYETPSIEFLMVEPMVDQPICRIGALISQTTLKDFSQFVSAQLSTSTTSWGSGDLKIRRVAVCGGAASDEWQSAQREGADVLVTGEVKQHHALEAAESGFALIQGEHYATEQPGCVSLCMKLKATFPQISWTIFVPPKGKSGNPL